MLGLVIMISSTAVFIRLIAEVIAVAPDAGRVMVPSLAAMLISMAMVLTAGVANIVFKGILAASLGSRALGGFIAMRFGAAIAGAGLIAWLWPQ